ncbi:MAG: type II citrate synthase [Spongiibacteraceae bacterium]
MAEIKRAVKTVEVNYVCDECNHGMMHKSGELDEATGDIPHKCVICGHRQNFKWVTYPRIDYIDENESIA